MNYLVDECFRAEVEKYHWSLHASSGRWIARRGECRGVRLHQYVWRLSGRPLPSGELSIDHINRDPSDNRLENLRLATARLQTLNRQMPRRVAELPCGVSLDSRRPKAPYRAKIRFDGGVRHLGYFATPEEASAAYEAELARQIEIEEARVQEILNVH